MKFIKVMDVHGELQVINLLHVISISMTSCNGQIAIETTSRYMYIKYHGGLKTFLDDISIDDNIIDVASNCE